MIIDYTENTQNKTNLDIISGILVNSPSPVAVSEIMIHSSKIAASTQHSELKLYLLNKMLFN